MTTALDIINDAMDDLTIKSVEVDLTTSEVSSAIRKLNRMLTSWDQGGIHLGFTKIIDSSDLITTPDWSEELITSHLAIRLAPSFGMQVAPELIALARGAMTRARRNLIQIGAVQLPNTLPVGAGNSVRTEVIFFNDETEGDLTTNSNAELTNDESVQLSVE